MKTRNLLIALTCIALFILAGVLYFKSWVVQKPFAIILITGDGLNTSSLAAARIYEGGADKNLALESLPHLGLLKLTSNEFAVPDAAAAASSLATGRRVNQNGLSVDSDGKKIATLLELAARAGRKTGVVTNASVVDPAVAAYFSHQTDGQNRTGVASELPDLENVDLLLGGGEKYFLPVDKGGVRTDGQDLILALRQKNWTVARTKAELTAIQSWLAPRTLGIFNRGELSNSRAMATEEPSLEELVKSAISLLQYNTKGYFLVIDAGLIEKAARGNDGENFLAETIALDNAVAVARRYAGDSALIVVAGKQAPGGFRMNGYPFRQDQGAAVLGVNAHGIPSLTWSTGPHALPPAPAAKPTPKREGEVLPSLIVPEPPLPEHPTPEPTPPQLPPSAAVEPSTVFTPESLNVVDDPLIFSSGTGSEKLTGYLDAKDVFTVVQTQL
ncbi:MAG: alkaline phosphatase [Chthoniobacterales bacterium]